MNNRKGILLVEFMIYLILFSIMAMLSASWVSYVWGHYIKQAQERHDVMTLYVAHDVLARDIKGMQHVIYCDLEYLVAQMEKDCIGWRKKKDQLLRIQGSYNITTKKWSAATQNSIVQPIDELSFNAHDDSVEFVLRAHTIKIHNRVNFDKKVFNDAIKK